MLLVGADLLDPAGHEPDASVELRGARADQVGGVVVAERDEEVARLVGVPVVLVDHRDPPLVAVETLVQPVRDHGAGGAAAQDQQLFHGPIGLLHDGITATGTVAWCRTPRATDPRVKPNVAGGRRPRTTSWAPADRRSSRSTGCSGSSTSSRVDAGEVRAGQLQAGPDVLAAPPHPVEVHHHLDLGVPDDRAGEVAWSARRAGVRRAGRPAPGPSAAVGPGPGPGPRRPPAARRCGRPPATRPGPRRPGRGNGRRAPWRWSRASSGRRRRGHACRPPRRPGRPPGRAAW